MSWRPCWRSKQRNGGHLGGVKYSFGDWTVFLCKFLLLFHYVNMAPGHMSEHTLLTVGWTKSSAPVRAVTYLKEQALNRLFKCHFPSSIRRSILADWLSNSKWKCAVVFILCKFSPLCAAYQFLLDNRRWVFHFFFSTKQALLVSERCLTNKR